MKSSESITHPDRNTNLFNTSQATQILYPRHIKIYSETNTAQQKQRKQLISTNIKNALAYRFQPMQRLQPIFKTDGIRNFMA